MSKEYAKSEWCRDEFEEAFFENRADPAFRIIVIMLDPVKDLGQVTSYMHSFFQSHTYLMHDDPELLPNIKDILTAIRPDATCVTMSDTARLRTAEIHGPAWFFDGKTNT